MAIRVDPRRLSLLKELAAAEGLRPGQLVQRWVEERLDAERAGETPSPAAGGRLAELESAVAALTAQVAEIASRVTQAAPRAAEPAAAQSTPPSPEPAEAAAPTEAAQEAPAPRRRGRPRKAPTAAAATSRAPAETGGRVALHDEIIAVIEERGPSTAAEIAGAISDRGRYRAPRSDRPLDAATVNSRVSNPVYRSRFVRSGHRIGLAQEG